MTHTYNTVAELLQERWESDFPDKVIEALRPLNGKPVTKRLLAKLPGGAENWRFTHVAGMTYLENRAYWMSQEEQWGKGAIRLLLDWRTDAFPLDVNAVIERNPTHFKGRYERNHARMEAKHDRKILERMAAVMNKAERARQTLADAKAEFEEIAGYGKPFNPDYYELERACGLREKEKA